MENNWPLFSFKQNKSKSVNLFSKIRFYLYFVLMHFSGLSSLKLTVVHEKQPEKYVVLKRHLESFSSMRKYFTLTTQTPVSLKTQGKSSQNPFYLLDVWGFLDIPDYRKTFNSQLSSISLVPGSLELDTALQMYIYYWSFLSKGMN